ncbi:hypothetical protein DIPPA_06179 [Diplonema papillatum]|nr:hypothetical protein DIPPA_06179 [Diplonema papillatum]
MSDANLCHPRRAPGVPLRPVVPPCPAWYVPNAHGHSKYKKLKSSLSGRLSPKQDDDDLLFAAFSHVKVDDIDATMPQEDSAGHLHSGFLSPPLAPMAEPSTAAPKDAALKEAVPLQAAPLTPLPFFSKWKEQTTSHPLSPRLRREVSASVESTLLPRQERDVLRHTWMLYRLVTTCPAWGCTLDG